MSLKLQTTELSQHGNTLKIQLNSNDPYLPECHNIFIETSSELVLCGLVKCLVNNELYSRAGCTLRQIVSIKLSKIFQSDHLNYAVKLTSETLKIHKLFHNVYNCSTIDNMCWQIIWYRDEPCRINDFDIQLSLNVSSSTFNGFASLIDDTDLSDFELRGVDGSVKVHKIVLASYNPVIKTMLSGQWKEVSTGVVEVANTTEETLQQLKDFMYLHKMPESGIEHLAVLASYYMMSDLEEFCTFELLKTLTTENTTKLLELAGKYKMERLMLAILKNIQNRSLSVDNIIAKH